jgi:hypothetical protein
VSSSAMRHLVLLFALSLLVAGALSPRPLHGQNRLSPATATQKPPQANQNAKGRHFFRIAVEDGIEAGLIEQQLKIKPALVRDGWFYYYGNEETNELLRRYGYEPMAVNPERVLTRVVRVIHKGAEEDLTKVGVVVILRERAYWIVRGTLAQLRLLDRLGYQVEELGGWEPRPRQIRVAVSGRQQAIEVGAHRVDIYSLAKAGKGYVVFGGAFDDSIDELRAAGFKVEILPDPPGVVR